MARPPKAECIHGKKEDVCCPPMSEIIEQRDVKGRFLIGGKAGPGRPRGARNKLAEHFIASFAADFEQHGPRVIAQVRAENPAIWLKIAGDLLPREAAAQLDPGADFRGCETAEEILRRLAQEDLQGNIAQARWMLDGLLAIAAEQARPIESDVGD